MKKGTIRVSFMVVALLLMVLPFAGACAPAEEAVPPSGETAPPSGETVPPPGEKVIQVGTFIGITGMMGPTISHCFYGYQDYWRYVNEKKGGINGIPVELLWEDDGYVVAKAIPAYKRQVEAGVLAVMTQNSGSCNAMKDMLAADKIPGVAASATPAAVYPPSWWFFNSFDYAEGLATFCALVKKDWKETRKPRFAYLTSDNPVGKGTFRADPYITDVLGFELVGREITGNNPSDVTTELGRLAEAKADFVFGNNGVQYFTVVLGDADKLGLTGKMKFMGAHYCQPWLLLETVSPEVAEGYLGHHFVSQMFETENQGIDFALELCEKYDREEATKRADMYNLGVVNAMMIEGAIKMALDENGYPITGQDVYNAFEKMKNLDLKKLQPPISFSSEKHTGGFVKMSRIENGKVRITSDWMEAIVLHPDEYPIAH